MKDISKLKQEIENCKNYVFLVEGKKDLLALKYLGFEKVYALHKNGVSLRERIEEIVKLLDSKDKVCILTDLDMRGKKFYALIKQILQEHRIKVDSRLRGLLLVAGLSHIEGLSKFMEI